MEAPVGEFPDSISIPTIVGISVPLPPWGASGRVDYIHKFLVLLRLGPLGLGLGGKRFRKEGKYLRRAEGTSRLLHSS